MNLCRACSTDFASVAAFDRHRVGTYAYAWSPEREDGRRCLIGDELLEAGLELDPKGRWRTALTDAERERPRGLGANGSAKNATQAA
jgi:hypothetical protein